MARPSFRKIALLVVTIVVAGVCVRLGFWQLGRLHGRRDINAQIAAGFAQPPQQLTNLLAQATDPHQLAFRRAEAAGTYDPAHEVILYGRTSAGGDTGNQVLTPLLLDDGTALLVDRGWVPLAQGEPPVGGPAAAPSGRVDVAGVLFPPDAETATAAGASPVLQVTKIDPGKLGAQLPYPILPVYLVLQEQRPAQAGGLPEPAPLPELTEGPHLSYAIQWFAFATIAVVGYGVLVRRDRREGRGAQAPPTPEGVAGREA